MIPENEAKIQGSPTINIFDRGNYRKLLRKT